MTPRPGEAPMGRGHPKTCSRGARNETPRQVAAEDHNRWGSMEFTFIDRVLRQRRAAGAMRLQDGRWMAQVPEPQPKEVYSARSTHECTVPDAKRQQRAVRKPHGKTARAYCRVVPVRRMASLDIAMGADTSLVASALPGPRSGKPIAQAAHLTPARAARVARPFAGLGQQCLPPDTIGALGQLCGPGRLPQRRQAPYVQRLRSPVRPTRMATRLLGTLFRFASLLVESAFGPRLQHPRILEFASAMKNIRGRTRSRLRNILEPCLEIALNRACLETDTPKQRDGHSEFPELVQSCLDVDQASQDVPNIGPTLASLGRTPNLL